MDGQSTVVEEAREANSLIARVADAVGDGRVVEDGRGLGVTPREDASTMGRERLSRILSFFLRGESASVRSIRNSAPMKPRATLARSGSEASALKKYRRECAQQLTSTTSPVW